MPTFLYIGFVLLGIISVALASGAASAIQEGVAAILFLCSIACLIGGGICSRLDRIHAALTPPTKQNQEPAAELTKRAPGGDSGVSAKVAALLILCGLIVLGLILGAIRLANYR